MRGILRLGDPGISALRPLRSKPASLASRGGEGEDGNRILPCLTELGRYRLDSSLKFRAVGRRGDGRGDGRGDARKIGDPRTRHWRGGTVCYVHI